jgi:hypothetical protein
MVANILIAGAFFALGFLLGGAFALNKSLKVIAELKKKLEEQYKSTIMYVYEEER